MNSRPDAWLHQARNDLALAQLAKDNGFLAQSCYFASQAAEGVSRQPCWSWGSNLRTPMFSTIWYIAWGTTASTPINSKRCP